MRASFSARAKKLFDSQRELLAACLVQASRALLLPPRGASRKCTRSVCVLCASEAALFSFFSARSPTSFDYGVQFLFICPLFLPPLLLFLSSSFSSSLLLFSALLFLHLTRESWPIVLAALLFLLLSLSPSLSLSL